MAVLEYLAQLGDAIGRQDGPHCAALLTLRSREAAEAAQGGRWSVGDLRRGLQQGLGGGVDEGWIEVAGLALGAQAAADSRDRLEKIGKLAQRIRALSDTEEWLLAAVCRLLDDYRMLAAEVDKGGTELNNVVNEIQLLQRSLQRDRSADGVRRLSMAYLLVVMYRIMLQAGAAGDPVRRFGNTLPDDLSLIPPCAAAAYSFVRGRSAFLEGHYDEACSQLWRAFVLCPPTAARNMGRILMLLVPLLALQGIYGSSELLATYGLHLYNDLLQAIRCGQVGVLEGLLGQHELLLLQRGVYVLWDRTRYLALRNMLLIVTTEQPGAKKLKWGQLQAALQATAMHVHQPDVQDMLEVVLLKYLRGSYVEAQQTLVLSKTATKDLRLQ